MYSVYNMDCIAGSRRYLADNSVDLIITDPPYGIEGEQLHRHYHRNESYVIEGYVEVPKSEYADFSLGWIKEAQRVLRPGGTLYAISGYTNLYEILSALRQTNLVESNHIIWKYNFGVYTSRKFVTSHYHILYFYKPGGRVTFNTFSRYGSNDRDEANKSLNYRDREDVWIINREYQPGQIKNKNSLPKELLIKLMQYSSNKNDIVVDFFLGGFTTAKVAIGMARKFVGFEINANTYHHHLKELELISPGSLLPSLATVRDKRPLRQHKPWTASEAAKLKKRYNDLFQETGRKGKTISILQDEFERGYFAILNKLKEITDR